MPALPARCLAADYLYPNGGPHARRFCAGRIPNPLWCVGRGLPGQIKVEAIRDARQNIQKSALSSDAEGRVLFIYGCAEPEWGFGQRNAENYGGGRRRESVPFDGFQCGGGAAHHPQPVCGLHHGTGADRRMCATLRTAQPELNEQNAQDLAFLY